MSASVTSSFRRPRTPQRERRNTESDKQQIRLVAYTPPSVGTDKAAFHAPAPKDAGDDSPSHIGDTPIGGTSARSGGEPLLGPALSSASSVSPTAPAWARRSAIRVVSDSSSLAHPPPSLPGTFRTSNAGSIRLVNTPIHRLPSHSEIGSGPPPVRTKPPTRRHRVLSINSDKTFSIQLKPTTPLASIGSESTLKSYNNSIFSHGESSTFSDERSSSLFSRLPGRSSISTQATTITAALNEDHGSSPPNPRMVGGLRQVVDPKDKGKGKEIAIEPLPTLEETTTAVEMPETATLAPKASFLTEHSVTTLEETANYKVLGPSSPQRISDENESPPSSSSNYQIHGQSSAPQSYASSPVREPSAIGTPESKNFIVHDSPYPVSEPFSLETPRSKNFVIHGNASPSPRAFPGGRTARNQSSFDSFSQESYSQESLIIPPLRPHKRSESEKLHLRTPGSSPHRRSNSYSSISSVFTQDTVPNVVLLPAMTTALPPRQFAQWTSRRPIPRYDVYQRSSQLSTVMSEHEDSDQMSHIDTSAEGKSPLGNPVTFQSHSRSESLDRPAPVTRSNTREFPNLVPTIRHHDEHGDGLADLKHVHQLQTKSSRGRLGFLSRKSSDKSLRSTISSRSRAASSSSRSRAGSFSSLYIPTWAKLYYGSGERRWLGAHISPDDDDVEPIAAWRPDASSPPQSRQAMAPQAIYNPRRRPREISQVEAPQTPQQQIIALEMEEPRELRQQPKKKTSSVWSPHLGLDRRHSRYDVWRPPSVKWSAEKNAFGRRNIQLLFFVFGFIFPFAWMIAAILPLPPNPRRDVEKDDSPPQITEETQPETRVAPADDALYQNARWWRNVNRYMSFVGVLLLGTIIALSILGVQQGW